MTPAEARGRFAAARVARLATVTPWLVPVCFAVDPEDDVIWTAVDDVKSKRGGRLRRLAEVEADPRVALLADHYDDDWSRLWWVRADGEARVLPSAPRAVALLSARYTQYQAAPPPGPVIEVRVRRWSGWAASGQ